MVVDFLSPPARLEEEEVVVVEISTSFLKFVTGSGAAGCGGGGIL